MPIFKIAKGSHYSNQWLYKVANIFCTTTLAYVVKFKENCLYDFQSIDDFDVNKLFGISIETLNPHMNSARFGWNCTEDKKNIKLFAYRYVNARPLIMELSTINVNKEYYLSISLQESEIIYEIDGKITVLNTYTALNKNKIYLPITMNTNLFHLFPYFGGNMPAPHDLEIEMTKM